MNAAISEMRANRALLLVLVAFAVLSAAYAFAARLKWGPDEPAHFIYARTIALHLAVPPISHEETGSEDSVSSHEGHQPPLYYGVMAVPFAILQGFGASTDLTWRVLRLLNIPMGIAWLLGVYALAFAYFEDRRRATAVTAFVAFIPTSSYTCGVINNENLISPLFTWSLVAIFAWFKSGTIALRTAVRLGVLVGLSILAKTQGITLIPLVFIASIALLRRDGYRNWKPVLSSLALVIAAAVILSGWWFVGNSVAYGTLIPQSLYRPVFAFGLSSVIAQPGALLTAASAATCLTYGHFWIPYWLVRPFVPYMSLFYPLCALTAVILIGLVLRLLRNSDVNRGGFLFLLASPLLVYLAWLRHALFVDAGANMQGRLFLCVAGVVGIAWVLGIEGLTPKEKARGWLKWSAYALLLASNVAVLACCPFQQ